MISYPTFILLLRCLVLLAKIVKAIRTKLKELTPEQKQHIKEEYDKWQKITREMKDPMGGDGLGP